MTFYVGSIGRFAHKYAMDYTSKVYIAMFSVTDDQRRVQNFVAVTATNGNALEYKEIVSTTAEKNQTADMKSALQQKMYQRYIEIRDKVEARIKARIKIENEARSIHEPWCTAKFPGIIEAVYVTEHPFDGTIFVPFDVKVGEE
jgi:hypothetical protein